MSTRLKTNKDHAQGDAGDPCPQMQRGEDRGLVIDRFVAGDVFRANYLKGERDSRGQHQEGVDGGGVRKPCGPQQSGGDDVVDEIGDAHQPRSGQQGQAAAQEFVSQLLVPAL